MSKDPTTKRGRTVKSRNMVNKYRKRIIRNKVNRRWSFIFCWLLILWANMFLKAIRVICCQNACDHCYECQNPKCGLILFLVKHNLNYYGIRTDHNLRKVIAIIRVPFKSSFRHFECLWCREIRSINCIW